MELSVFVLSAGYGSRLKPITEHIPKPLLPILGKPLLQIVFERCLRLKPQGFIINTHHLHTQIEDFASHCPFSTQTHILYEPTILGTGGGIKNAQTLLKKTPYFLTHNADIYCDIDLEHLFNVHKNSSNIATLAVHNYAPANNVVVDEEGSFVRIHSKDVVLAQSERLCAFIGIAVYSSEFLKLIQSGFSSVLDAWAKAVALGYKIGTVDFSGCYFSDIGSPFGYAQTVFDALKNSGENFHIHESAYGCRDINLEGFVSIEANADVSVSQELTNCIILPHTILKDPKYCNCIVCKDDIIALPPPSNTTQISTGGSERRYFRVFKDGKSFVQAKYFPTDPDMQRHIQYTHFFSKHGLSVPEIYAFDEQAKEAIFEDLGDMSLYAWLKCKENLANTSKIYKQVLDELTKLHSIDTKDVADFRIFDYEYFCWESKYFLDNFITAYCQIHFDEAIFTELKEIARQADSFFKCIIHRDLQSQNIFIKTDKVRLIDYQGARLGPPAYDIASLLYDPYVEIDEGIRVSLIDYYMSKMSEFKGFDISQFKQSLLFCRLQRHMQALGAYAFLALAKGKRYFLKHIPRCLKMLEDESKQYKILHGLVKKAMLTLDLQT